MTDNVVPLRFNVQEVGKHVKSSKKRFTWDVSLGSKQHSIVLDFSFISGKVKVTVDRKVLLQNQLPANTSFQYPFTLDGNSLNVIQQGQSFELRINNKVFSHLYNQMKTNKQFKKYEDEVKDFKVTENQFQAKKVTLNIGGVGGGMKKKPRNQSDEGHNWNAFGGDEMNNFPNYFEGQSVSTNASTEKVEQAPQVAQRKVHDDLLGEDSEVNVNPKQDKTQNILDFEAEIQNTPPQQTLPTRGQDEFNTMQMMFQSMGVNSFQQQPQQQKPTSVLDSGEVDFFNNVVSEQTKPQAPIDFFSQTNNSSINTQPQPQQSNDYNTMRHMFATGAQNIPSNVNQFAFSTMNNSMMKQPQQPLGGETNWNNYNIQKQPEIQGITLNTNTTQEQPIDVSNFSTLQGLFATNVLGSSQPINFAGTSNAQQQQTFLKQQQVPAQNYALNAQHFATQQLPGQFGTSFNLNTQAFGTQNFMAQNPSQQINFLAQQSKPTQPAQQFIQPQTIQHQPPQLIQPPSQPQPQINASDFNSMQYLFQTNVTPLQQSFPQQQTPVITPPVISMQKSQQSFTQQFATSSGSLTQSPNSMFMNTYGGGGSGNPNLSFDVNLNQQQFATSVNPSMMKKKPAETTSAADLL